MDEQKEMVEQIIGILQDHRLTFRQAYEVLQAVKAKIETIDNYMSRVRTHKELKQIVYDEEIIRYWESTDSDYAAALRDIAERFEKENTASIVW